ncbi:MAG: hypothetical protein IPH06_12705 [Alphaproteobacteria bacterium]|nr:hypothetical protein [Alphaproteobacteria bacterium]QQS56325.1 MAG: hypothetical protein IPN28_08460 [Alphaproteobacteria bacterium]
MLSQEEFISKLYSLASEQGYSVYQNKKGLMAIDFGHKQLHEGHLKALWPQILQTGAQISKLIECIAPGRPCTHKPMKELISKISVEEVA